MRKYNPMSEITTKPKSNQELIILDDTVLNTILEQLSEGKTLASIRKEGTLPISLIKFYQFLKHLWLRKHPLPFHKQHHKVKDLQRSMNKLLNTLNGQR